MGLPKSETDFAGPSKIFFVDFPMEASLNRASPEMISGCLLENIGII
jgi:hypothetical protein